VSFGGLNSTISLPNYMSHASIPKNLRAGKIIPSDLVRLSVGVEDVEDLLDDLGHAFEAACAQREVAVDSYPTISRDLAVNA
jgi:cysteine-S-conjugate beta-lyase